MGSSISLDIPEVDSIYSYVNTINTATNSTSDANLSSTSTSISTSNSNSTNIPSRGSGEEIESADEKAMRIYFEDLSDEVLAQINLYYVFNNFYKRDETIINELRDQKESIDSKLNQNKYSLYILEDDIDNAQRLLHKKKNVKSLINKGNIVLGVVLILICVINKDKLFRSLRS